MTASGSGSGPAVQNLLQPWRLFFVGYALLGVAWLATSPPWSAPDEPAALAKGLDVAHGHLLGHQPDYDFDASTFIEQWYRRLTRTIDVPDRQVPPALIPCFAFDSAADASCLERDPVPPFSETPTELAAHDPRLGDSADIRLLIARLTVEGSTTTPDRVAVTYLGTYQPFAYGIPALLALPASDASAALYLARIANLAVCVGLIGLGLRALARIGGPLRWLGTSLALTPTVLYCAATLSSSGPELAAAFCHISALLVWHREKELSTPVRRALLASGAVLAVARTLGPGWLLLFDGAAAIAIWRSRTWRSGSNRWLVKYSVVVGALAAVNLGWQVIVQPSAADRVELGTFVRRSLHEMGGQFNQQVGVFGWLDTRLPGLAYRLWAVIGLLLLVAAFAVAGRAGRTLLTLIAAGSFVAVIFVAVTIAYPVQSGPQGRWTLPLTMALPLVAAALVDHRRLGSATWVKRLAIAMTIMLVGIQAAALWAAARRNAVGTSGTWWFLGTSQWHPPLGWGPWVLTVGAAAGLIVIGALSAGWKVSPRPPVPS